MRLLLLFIFSSPFLQAQQTPVSEDVALVHSHWCGNIDHYAFYPGGEEAFIAYMSEDMNYLYCASSATEYPTRIYMSFTLNKDGSVTDVRVERSICPEIDGKVMKRIKNMKCNSAPGTRRMRIPVRIELRG